MTFGTRLALELASFWVNHVEIDLRRAIMRDPIKLPDVTDAVKRNIHRNLQLGGGKIDTGNHFRRRLPDRKTGVELQEVENVLSMTIEVSKMDLKYKMPESSAGTLHSTTYPTSFASRTAVRSICLNVSWPAFVTGASSMAFGAVAAQSNHDPLHCRHTCCLVDIVRDSHETICRELRLRDKRGQLYHCKDRILCEISRKGMKWKMKIESLKFHAVR